MGRLDTGAGAPMTTLATKAAVRLEPEVNSAAIANAPQPERWTRESVISVGKWDSGLLTFRISRPAGYSFVAGRYARIGLADD